MRARTAGAPVTEDTMLQDAPIYAYLPAQDVERARSAGFDHHLVKPLDLQQLAKLISERVAG